MARGSVPAPLALGPPLSDQGQEQLSFKSIQTPHHQNAPSIRLIHATPHSTDPLTDGSLNSDIGFPNISINADNSIANSSWAAVPFDAPQAPPSTSVLAPKEERNGSKKRLVLKQKKSKLSLLVPSSKSSNSQVPPTSLRGSSSRADFSDVARRIGITSGSASGFDIYVDHSSPNDDVNAGEVVMVKKKKSRAGLNGFQWGAMGEVTNIPAVPKEDGKLKDSGKETKEGSGRWWAIGRGRKDSRDTERNENIRPRSKSPGPVEQFKKITSKRDRSRFNSFDSGLLLNSSSTQHSAAADAPPAMQRSTSVSNVLQIISTSGAADPDMLDPSSLFVAGSDIPKDPIPSRSLTPTFVREICSIDTVGARPSEPGPSSAPPVENGFLAPPTEDGFLAPPISGSHPCNAAQSSIAQRAMRSVRSLARIGSWAQIRNTATINHDDDVSSLDDIKPTAHKSKKDMETTTKKTASKKRAALSSNAFSTVRSSSGSSFEAGYLSPIPTKEPTIRTSTLGRRKASVLGLGLPSTVRNPSSLRVSSATPSVPNQVSKMGTFTTNTGPPTSFNASRLPGDFNSSCHHEVPTRDRPPSMGSTTSSLRPSSITSRTSSNGGSSTASVRWDEEKLRTVKENRKRERAEKKERDRAEGKTESKHTGGSKRHTPLSEIFPLDVQAAVERSVADILNPHREISDDDEDVSQTMALPKLTLERATNDGHEAVDDSPAIDSEDDAGREDLTDIPSTRGSLPRLRSKSTSAQLAPRSRPKAIHDEGSVLSMLDQATNELAHLLNHLDLEATPSPARTSLSDSSSTEKRVALIAQAGESPVKKVPKEPMPALGARASSASITSLRPYAQSRGAFTKGITTPTVQPSELYGQPIAPWKVLNRSFSPPRPKVSDDASAQTVRPSPLVTKLAQSPPRAPEPPLVFQPLGPANKKQLRITKTPGMPNESLPPTPLTIVPSPAPLQNGDDDRSPSTNTFGSAPSSPVLPLGQSPVFKRKGHARQRSSLGQYELIPMAMEEKRNSIPIEPEGRKILGLSGTMGASTTPESTNLDLDDPDSDIPYELQAIIAASSDDDAGSINSSTTASTETQPDQQEANIPNASSSSSSGADLAFHAHLNDDSASLDIDGEGLVRGEEDTTKSFDFTGELAKLNESGARDRRSFVEQLENAFRTPAKINLRYDFGLSKTSLLEMEIPPVPRLPSIYAAEASMSMDSENLPFMKATADCEFIRPDPEVPQDISCVDASLDGLSSAVKAVDVSIPFIQTDALITRDGHQVQDDESLAVSRLTRSVSSRPSDGRLDFNFKFGGSTSSHNDAPSAPLTLSDIIPPPPEAHRLSNISVVEEDGSVLKSVKAQAMELPVHLDLPLPPSSRPRIDSDTSYKGSMEESVCKPVTSDHSRRESTLSFLGFESFDEVRRGFEFNGDRPGFYPMALAEYGQSRSQLGHNKHDSGFSIPSVSSYGAVLRPGLPDPFEYGTTDMQSHRISDDMSMSIDDTFDFVKRNQRRTRVDSDTSSFYFRPLSMNMGRHRNRDSVASVSSMTGPPVSIYNRSFGAYSQRRNSAYLSHRREDSDASASSVALSYAMHGAVGGRRPVLSRHLQGMSTDSMFSDFSPAQATRPGLGDKMFQSLDHGMPLTSISASPNSLASKHVGDYTTYEERSPTDYCDSLMDDLPPFSFGPLFERARHRTSTSSESIFGTEEAKASAPIPNALAPPFQFRPLSMTSFSDEDYNEFILNADEGDDTLITMFDGDHVRRQSMGSVINASPCIRMEKRKPSTAPHQAAPINNVSTIPPTIKSRVIEEKPLIASASPSHSGGEHMTKARHSLLEQQSLEGCVPIPSKDLLPSARQAVFTRPATTGRSRSSTVTSNSSDADTPPLSISGDSLSGGSQSSIDLSSIDLALSHLSHSDELSALGRVRARARGQGHRRRISQARMSRASVYETIEELPELIEPSSPDHHMSLKDETIQVDPNNSVFVDPDTATDSMMIDSTKLHTNVLHKYYALKDEAVETVTESRVVWPDTQFSAYAMQSFVPPEHPAGMQAMLEHSVKTYGPLPLELRPHRTRKRTLSRPSPYPSTKIHASPDESRVLILETSRPSAVIKRALTEVSLNPNVSTEPGPSINIKPLSSFKDTSEKPQVSDFQSHPRVVPSSNRSALGWVKRNTSKTNVGVDKKENNSLGTSMVLTSGESLRINRPRPRGRPMPTTSRPIRI